MSAEATPSGLDLKPKINNVERLSKRAGLLMVLVLAALFGLIIYGVLTRQPSQPIGIQDGTPKAATAATLAAREIAGEVPDGNMGRLTAPATPANARDALLPVQPPVNYNATNQNAGPQGQTPEERRLSEAYALEQEARRASTSANAGGGSRAGIDSLLSGAGGTNQLDGLLRSISGGGGASTGLDAALRNLTSGGGGAESALRNLAAGPGAGAANEFATQNNQQFKTDFAKASAASNQAAYLKSIRTAQISPFEVKAGWDIPASMEQGINSDLPGELKALITQNVYDTASGRHLLIPQGTRALGIYSSNISFGQQGVQAVWQRLIFPDGSSIDLGSMIGQDAAGYSGFRDKVNNHWGRLISGALLSSVFTAGFQISQGSGQSSNGLGVQSNSQIAAAAAGQEVSRVGSEITRRNLNIQPTIEIRPGYRFNIRVNRDMLFEAPYSPLAATR
jgi:type IV secretion system protein TrbI